MLKQLKDHEDQPRLVTIDITGSVKSIDLDHVPKFTELQSIVGGPIEIIPYFHTYNGLPCVAFCNEEGKLKGLLINRAATAFWQAAVGINRRLNDHLVGDIAIITGPRSFLDRL